MELKWLEDFVCLAGTRSFSRAAEERHVTQSAFSRRIRALETWLGVVLVDRATQPIVLTEAGRRFLETAEETVRQLYASRQQLQARPRTEVVAIAALHTLALHFFPHWFRQIEDCVGPLQSRLLPDGLLSIGSRASTPIFRPIEAKSQPASRSKPARGSSPSQGTNVACGGTAA